MEESEGFDQGDHVDDVGGGATSFSQLLFSDDDVVGLDMGQSQSFSYSFTSEKPPKMLCFGSYQSERETTKTPQKSGVTCSDSSSVSSGNNSSVNTLAKSNRKRNGSDQESVQCTSIATTTPLATQRTSKKTKTENPTITGHAKVKKEKLGERITALQQLVSPFGKTDTASVLHEAMGYIRFLHDQVQVLCSAYLQHLPEGGENGGRKSRASLRSRGLCLVPVACTVDVANSNGADFWSPVMGHNVSSTKQ